MGASVPWWMRRISLRASSLVGPFVGGEAALGETVGDRVAVGAADLHRDGELLHNVHEFGFGDCGRQDGEVSEVVGYVGSFSLGQSEELAKNLPAPELREEGRARERVRRRGTASW